MKIDKKLTIYRVKCEKNKNVIDYDSLYDCHIIKMSMKGSRYGEDG